MKTGKNLVELAQEVMRQQETKRDYIVQSSAIRMTPEASVVTKPTDIMPLTPIAHQQLATYLDIPTTYYERMRSEKPALLAENVNDWLAEKSQEKRMLRVLDGKIRAVPSDSYRRIDNSDLLEAVLPAIQAADMMLLSCEITERRLYLKAVSNKIKKDIPCDRKLGDGSHIFFDTLAPGITISNSEVCFGSMLVETSVWTKACTNLAMMGSSLKRRHVGKKQDLFGEDFAELLSDTTKELTDRALFSQVRDVVGASLDELRFGALVERIQETQEKKIEKPIVEFVDVTAKKLGIQEREKQSVLTHLISGGDLSQYGLFNALTRTAEDIDDYDRATEFERFGGRVIELNTNEWRELAA